MKLKLANQGKKALSVYMSGPMTGLPNNNVEAFNSYTKQWNDAGYVIVNPASFEEKAKETYTDWLKRDVSCLINSCNAIAMMPGWEKSNGARLEYSVACSLGYLVFDATQPGKPFLVPEEEVDNRTVCEIADQLTSKDRQKVYGSPDEDFTRQANMLNALGYSFTTPNGTTRQIFAQDISVIMICTKLSRLVNSNLNHRDSIVDICGYAKCLDQINQATINIR